MQGVEAVSADAALDWVVLSPEIPLGVLNRAGLGAEHGPVFFLDMQSLALWTLHWVARNLHLPRHRDSGWNQPIHFTSPDLWKFSQTF